MPGEAQKQMGLAGNGGSPLGLCPRGERLAGGSGGVPQIVFFFPLSLGKGEGDQGGEGFRDSF